MTQADTLPKLLLAAATGPGARRVALRQKRLGIWQTVTWVQYLARVREAYYGLLSLGLADGERIAVLAENVPEWVYTDLAVQVARGCVVGIFPQSQTAEITYLLEHAEIRFIVVGDQEQADKILALDAPYLKRVIVIDDRGMAGYEDPRLLTFATLLERGRAVAGVREAEFAAAVAAGTSEDPSTLLYTSGTTGKPKGVLLTQRNAISAGLSMLESERLTPGDQVISYLPFGWVGERMFSIWYALAARYVVNFPEDADMEVVLANWREVQPTFLLAPPRIWERLTSSVFIGIDNTTWFKRLAFRTLMPLGYEIGNARLEGRRPRWWARLLAPAGEWLLFRWLRDRMGLTRCRSVFTGGAPLGPEVFTFLHAIGINLRQVYGQTECCGVAVTHTPDRPGATTVGRPVKGMEARISETGEVLLRGPLVFAGYLKNPEATAQTFDDGWLRTGDQGYFREDGELIVVDRMKDVARTSAGAEFSPQLLENKLKFSRYIREAVVVGNERPYVGALVQIDYENVGNWATRRGITYTTFKDLSQRPEVQELIDQEVESMNRALPEPLRIRRLHLLDKELDADDEEITRTTKLRRAVVERKYGELIAGLYAGLAGDGSRSLEGVGS